MQSLINPPAHLSRRQILVLDGLRYASLMADVAYRRLEESIREIEVSRDDTTATQIAAAMTDAWAIVDNAHRFHDLLNHMPRLPRSTWRRVTTDRLQKTLDLRNAVQHQLGELDNVTNEAGYMWGYLSWAQFDGGKHTGHWFMISPGASFSGDQWLFMGPHKTPERVRPGMLRLNAFGAQMYLSPPVDAMRDALAALDEDVASGKVLTDGTTVTARVGVDEVTSGGVVVITRSPVGPMPVKRTPAKRVGILGFDDVCRAESTGSVE